MRNCGASGGYVRARAAVIGLLQMTTMAPHAVHATLQAENKYRVIQCQGGGKKGVPSDQVRLIYLGFLAALKVI